MAKLLKETKEEVCTWKKLTMTLQTHHVCPLDGVVRERGLNRWWIYEWFKRFGEHPNVSCSKCDYATWWVVSQSLKFNVLYQYGWEEEREESNLLN